MAQNKISDTMLETARQDYLAGKSLREISTKRGISIRKLAELSKAEGWVGQRRREQIATGLPELVRSVESRVEVLTRSQRERLKYVENQVGTLIVRLSEDLASIDFGQLDPLRRLSLLRTATDIYNRVHIEEKEISSRPSISIQLDTGGGSKETEALFSENEILRKQCAEAQAELEQMRIERMRQGSIESIVRHEVERALSLAGVAEAEPESAPAPRGRSK